MIDSNYRRAMIGAQEDFGQFFFDLVSNPISLVLTIALALMLISQLPLLQRKRAPGGLKQKRPPS